MSETRDGNIARRLLVVGAHSGDFVWRSAGAIAAATSGGGEAKVVALSYGERGESGDLWNEPGQTVENVKKMRHAQSEAAAAAIGAEFVCMDLGDYPLRVNEKVVDQLAGVIREFSPDVILTHTERDPFNPDHPVTHAAVLRARLLASGAGVASAFKTIKPPESNSTVCVGSGAGPCAPDGIGETHLVSPWASLEVPDLWSSIFTSAGKVRDTLFAASGFG